MLNKIRNRNELTYSIFCFAFCMTTMFSISTNHPFQAEFAYAGDNPGTWDYYKNHFISSDGRVTDFFQNNISHSEGQGYGLLLSLYNNDKITFEKLLNWTRNNIMVRKDGLAAWSWGKRDNGQWGVLDYNNASDGDILIAWALLNASEKWRKSEWKAWSDATIDRIRQSLVIKRGNRMVMLPGYYGFTAKVETEASGESSQFDKPDKSDNVTISINPAYFIFPAFNAFAESGARSGDNERKKFWKQVCNDSLAILKESLSSSMNLPPDWMLVNQKGNLVTDKDKGRNFGYEAIRVPLYLSMGGDKKHLEIFKPYLEFCNRLGYFPATVDLMNEQITIEKASAGFHAVFAKCAEMVGDTTTSKSLMQRAEIKIMEEPDDYYSNTLYLLAKSIQQ